MRANFLLKKWRGKTQPNLLRVAFTTQFPMYNLARCSVLSIRNEYWWRSKLSFPDPFLGDPKPHSPRPHKIWEPFPRPVYVILRNIFAWAAQPPRGLAFLPLFLPAIPVTCELLYGLSPLSPPFTRSPLLPFLYTCFLVIACLSSFLLLLLPSHHLWIQSLNSRTHPRSFRNGKPEWMAERPGNHFEKTWEN